MTEFLLKYSHNVIEHLGLKLYQNKPTNVLAEIVSNSWDADASRANINMSRDASNRWIAVHDNGHGMTRDVLQTSYLVIGFAKRDKPTSRSDRGRPYMGRKGIGKLAPFGIARYVDVLTCAKDDKSGGVYWLRFDLASLLGQGDKQVTYRPEIIVDGVKLAELSDDKDTTGEVAKWRDFIAPVGSGTLILMSELSLGKEVNPDQLSQSLASRFTIAEGRGFELAVNGKTVSYGSALPHLEMRIPDKGVTAETVNGEEVRYWVGFVETAAWPQDQAGVGVYSHGKIAQDRPFTFGVKGKEIFTRYMFACVEADWLDEKAADLISTDRTNVNWESPDASPLYVWGQEKVKQWVAEFERWRKSIEEAETRALVRENAGKAGTPKVTSAEEEEIVKLVSSITPQLGKDSNAKNRLVSAVSEAWVQKPMRRLVKDLWSSVASDGGMAPDAFTKLVEKLSSHSVPESLNLAVVFAQRAFALTRLHDYVHHGKETDLQKLIERFPWIIEPDYAVLTANQQLKTAIEKAERLGHLTVGRRTEVAGVPDVNKPDFVFLSSPEEKRIVVVELKNPQETLTLANRAQLTDYLTYFEGVYPHSERKGYLVGNNALKLEARHTEMEVLPWTDILKRSRARNLELLAAMLLLTGASGGNDARIADALQLGGPEAQDLLKRLAVEHEEIRELIQSFKLV